MFSLAHSPGELVQLRSGEQQIIILGIEDHSSLRFTGDVESTNFEQHKPTEQFWQSLHDGFQTVMAIREHKNAMDEFGVPELCLDVTDYRPIFRTDIPEYETKMVTHIMEILKLNLDEHNSLFNGNDNIRALINRAFQETDNNPPFFVRF